MIITIDLRPVTLKRAAVGSIQDMEHMARRRLEEIELSDLIGIAILVMSFNAAAAMHPAPVLAAYHKGDLMVKAQPIIDVLKDASEPVAYGMYIWSFIEYILGKRGEAKEKIKGTTWGFVGIQILPWLFSIVKSVGDM